MSWLKKAMNWKQRQILPSRVWNTSTLPFRCLDPWPQGTAPFHVWLEIRFGQVFIIDAKDKKAEHTPLPLRKVLRVNPLSGFLSHFIGAVAAAAGGSLSYGSFLSCKWWSFSSSSQLKVRDIWEVTSCTRARRGSVRIFQTLQAPNSKDCDLWGGMDLGDTKPNSLRALSILWAKSAPNLDHSSLSS